MHARAFCGWLPNPDGVRSIITDEHAEVWKITGDVARELGYTLPGSDRRPIILFDALKPLHPTWRRGAQAIGDCVSWGFELGALLAMACNIAAGEPWEWVGEVATEPIYGGSRVEARGVKRGGYSDGSYGAAAAKWLTKWGVLHRLDYSIETGVKDHDLRKYSGDRAKEWGNFGCGGEHDADKLDAIARTFPVRKAFLVETWEQYVFAIENGYPVAICSSQGLGDRDRYGFAPARGTWMHCMLGSGARFDREGGLITNSWGDSWGTRAPFYVDVNTGEALDYWPSVVKCSAWVERRVIEGMLRAGDSFALTGVDGLKRREIDWSKGWNIEGRT